MSPTEKQKLTRLLASGGHSVRFLRCREKIVSLVESMIERREESIRSGNRIRDDLRRLIQRIPDPLLPKT